MAGGVSPVLTTIQGEHAAVHVLLVGHGPDEVERVEAALAAILGEVVVTHAETGAEALGVLSQHAGVIGLVVVDLQTPSSVPAHWVARSAQRQNIPVISVTSKEEAFAPVRIPVVSLDELCLGLRKELTAIKDVVLSTPISAQLVAT